MAEADDLSRVRVHGWAYALVWLALLALAGLNFGLGHLALGSFSLPVALIVAGAQDLLIALYFMHLVEQRGSRRFAMPVALFYVFLIAALVFADVAFRWAPVRPGGIARPPEVTSPSPRTTTP